MIKIYCDSCEQEIKNNYQSSVDIDIDDRDCKKFYHIELCPKCKEKFKRMVFRIARKYGAR